MICAASDGGRWQGIRQAVGAGLRRVAWPSSLLCAVHASAIRFFSAACSSCQPIKTSLSNMTVRIVPNHGFIDAGTCGVKANETWLQMQSRVRAPEWHCLSNAHAQQTSTETSLPLILPKNPSWRTCCRLSRSSRAMSASSRAFRPSSVSPGARSLADVWPCCPCG